MFKRNHIFAIAIVGAAFALSPAAVAAQGAPVSAPIFPGPDGKPHYLLGVSASGSTQDLDRLQAASKALGYPSVRDLDANGKVSLVIAFPKETTEQVQAFLKRASGGEFGKFTFESTMAPVKP